MTGVGPFPIQVVIVFFAALVAWIFSRALARRLDPQLSHQAPELMLDTLLWGMLGARIGYIAQWWSEYSTKPLSIFTIGDGGFSWWTGLLTAMVFIGWRKRTQRMLGISMIVGVCLGLVFWFSAGKVIGLWQRSTMSLPDILLATLDKKHPVNLSAFKGQPVVFNLWASWCPPCRREMSVFKEAQEVFPEISFVMINQGETAQQVGTFLKRNELVFQNVLLDPTSKTMGDLSLKGLPVTLFFDAQGRLVGSHMGELTIASLKDTLSLHFTQSFHPLSDKEIDQ